MMAATFTGIFVILLCFCLLYMQDRIHGANIKRLRDKIADLSSAVLSKQMDYVAAKEEIKNLEAVREQLEKDLATSQRLGKDWLDLRDKEIEARTNALKDLDKELAAKGKAKADMELLQFRYERLQAEHQERISELALSQKRIDDMAEWQKGQKEEIERLQEVERNVNQVISTAADVINQMLEGTKSQEEKREQELSKLRESIEEQRGRIATLAQNDATYRQQIKKYVELLSREGREHRQMALDCEKLKVVADREEEKRSKLFAFSQSYLRRLMLPEYRVKEYCRLAEEQLKEPEDVLDSLLTMNNEQLTMNNESVKSMAAENSERAKNIVPPSTPLDAGGEYEMSPLPAAGKPGIAHNQASASVPDNPDADLPEMPF